MKKKEKKWICGVLVLFFQLFVWKSWAFWVLFLGSPEFLLLMMMTTTTTMIL
jgi:hypothetical protein